MARQHVRLLTIVTAYGATQIASLGTASAAESAPIQALQKAAASRAPLQGQRGGSQKWNAQTVERLAAWFATPVETLRPSTYDLAFLKSDLARPVGIVVAGGVSLGSYQAGFLYYYTQFLVALRDQIAELNRNNSAALPELSDYGIRLATGASAGSINAFLSVIETCRNRTPDPRNSLFYQSWIPIGLTQLMSQDRDTDALLSRKAINHFIRDKLEPLLSSPQGWAATDCKAKIGLSATRIHARSINVLQESTLEFAKQAEKFIIEVQRKPQSAPTFTVVNPSHYDGRSIVQRVYPVLRPHQLEPSTVADLLNASSSFPAAFAPVPLNYDLEPREPPGPPERHLDGGVFDNTPVRLAARIHDWTKKEPGMENLRLLFLETDVLSWKRGQWVKPGKEPPDRFASVSPSQHRVQAGGDIRETLKHKDIGFLDTLVPFAEGFIASARGAEMIDTLQSHPDVWDHIEIPQRNIALAGEHFANFFGFLEEDFRRHDFFAGAVDAWHHLAGSSLAFQVMSWAGRSLRVDAPEWQCAFDYRHHVVSGGKGDKEAIKHIGSCTELGSSQSGVNFRALLVATHAARAYSAKVKVEKKDKPELDEFVGTLVNNGFTFREVKYRGDTPTNRNEVRLAIRENMQELIERLGEKQTVGDRLRVETAGKVAANYFEYWSPRYILGLGATNNTGLDFHVAARLFGFDHTRFQVNARLIGFRGRYLDPISDPKDTTYLYNWHAAPAIVHDLQFWPFGPIVQGELGLGWNFVWTGTSPQFTRYMWRTGPELSGGLVLMQRVFVHVAYNYFIGEADCEGRNDCSRIAPNHRMHEVPLVNSNHEVRGSFGFRLLFQ